MKIITLQEGKETIVDTSKIEVIQQLKENLGIDKVDNTSDFEKPISEDTIDYIQNTISANEKGVSIGSYNASTNLPALTSTPNIGFKDGDYYEVTTSGTLNFTGENFISGQFVNIGDRLRKHGNQWYFVNLSSFPDIVKGIISHNDSVLVDKNISNAIKYVFIELKNAYAGHIISIRLLGYESTNGLIIQIYSVTNSSVIYTIKLSSDTSKPNGIKRYNVHLNFEYYIDLIIDWSAFAGSLLQSNTYSVLLAYNNYNSNRLSIAQFSNGIKVFSVNGTDEKINFAIKNLRFENVKYQNDWALYTLGWDGTALYVRFRDLTTSSVLHVKLQDTTSKPSGIQRYVINNVYSSFIDITVDWDSFISQNLISSSYTAKVVSLDYDNNRVNSSNTYNGIIPNFIRNGLDDKIAYAIKSIYFEYVDSNVNFGITQIGFNGTSLVLILRNLISNTNYTIYLSSDTSKPSGIKRYSINKTNEYYLDIYIDWDSFTSQSVLSTTFSTRILTNPYNLQRANAISELDYHVELFKYNSGKKYINGVLDLSKYQFETGTINTGQDSNNSNRLRTKYSIRVKTGTTINYNIALGYKIIIQQVITNDVKTFSMLKDNGALTGIGSIVLDTNCESVRFAFIKLASDNTTEIPISLSEITSFNFYLNTDYAVVDSVNSATKFTDNQLMNYFIKELYIEGLNKTKSYYIYHVRRNVSGSWRLYIYDKETNLSVFSFGTQTGDFNENGIFDRTLNGVRVRGIFDWDVLPQSYHNLGMTVNLNSRVFNLKFSPTIAAFYSDKELRGNKLFTTRNVSAIDNNHIFNAILPHKNFVPALMNSLNADITKANTIVSYDTIPYDKNGSVGIMIDNKFYECCQERDTTIYDSTSNIFVRVVDVSKLAAFKSNPSDPINNPLLSKTKILGYGDLIGGQPMSKIPYTYSCFQINANTIRILVRVRISNVDKFGYIDFNITNLTYSVYQDLTLNGANNLFTIGSYYNYIRDNVDSTLTSIWSNATFGPSIGRHVMIYNNEYYMLLGNTVGLPPYTGTYHSIAKSTDGINWNIIFTYKNRGGQDDGDCYIRNGIFYAQLRENWGSLFSTISAFNLATGKEVTNQMIKASTSRGEFFEYNNSLYLLINSDENRQYAILYKVIYANESLELIPVLSTEGWWSNWTIYTYNSKVYVFFGVSAWEFKIDEYNTSVANKLFDLLKN